MQRRLALVLSLACSALPAAAAQTTPATTQSTAATPAQPSPASADQTAPLITETFTIGPGDIVRVRIWREPTLDGDFQVDEVGRLTLPLLGTRTVTGVRWLDLRDSLLVAYRRELKAPSVTLTPLRRVYVLGEVNRPGVYLADPTLSLAGIVALAGGASPIGDLGKLRVVRQGQTVVAHAAIEEQLLQVGVRSEDQVFVDRRNWFELNSTFVASAAISIATILITFVHR
jgi:Periplasmic protein involved in polysaccharide export